MSALTPPLDNRESNNYIAALAEQFRHDLRSARDVSVYFTSRPDTEDPIVDGETAAFFQEYKLLDTTVSPAPDITEPLSSALSLAQYQIWYDDTTTFTVTGTGVLQLNAYWLIPNGAEVTVSQNGSGSVPSAETFVAVTDPFVSWIQLDGSTVVYFYPHTGKAWYGVLTAPAEDADTPDQLRIVLLRPDGTWHSQKLGSQVNENFVFFTHLYNTSINASEVYFTGKELTYVPVDLPTDPWVEPEFTYVPD